MPGMCICWYVYVAAHPRSSAVYLPPLLPPSMSNMSPCFSTSYAPASYAIHFMRRRVTCADALLWLLLLLPRLARHAAVFRQPPLPKPPSASRTLCLVSPPQPPANAPSAPPRLLASSPPSTSLPCLEGTSRRRVGACVVMSLVYHDIATAHALCVMR